jgi:hypothetical protein
MNEKRVREKTDLGVIESQSKAQKQAWQYNITQANESELHTFVF